MKKLELNQMENLNGGKISGRGCFIAGVAAFLSFGIAGGVLPGLGIISAAALSDCF